MTFRSRRIAAVLGAAAIAVPAVAASPATADHGHGKSSAKSEQGKSKGTAKSQGKKGGKQNRGKSNRSYVFKGTFNVADGSVTVTSGNKHARTYVGQAVVLNLSKVKVKVADTNGDGAQTIADVADGDQVKVQAKRKNGEFIARKLTDLTRPQVDDSTDEAAGVDAGTGTGTETGTLPE